MDFIWVPFSISIYRADEDVGSVFGSFRQWINFPGILRNENLDMSGIGKIS